MTRLLAAMFPIPEPACDDLFTDARMELRCGVPTNVTWPRHDFASDLVTSCYAFGSLSGWADWFMRTHAVCDVGPDEQCEENGNA